MAIDAPQFLIRPLRSEDVAAVAAIEQQANPDPWSARQIAAELTNPGSRFELLIAEAAIAAYLCCWQVLDELQIQNVATAPGFRRRGYAASLLRHVLRRAKADGVTRVVLEVRTGNAAARSLYESFGFTGDGIRPNYYAGREDALLMTLDLVKSGTPADRQQI